MERNQIMNQLSDVQNEKLDVEAKLNKLEHDLASQGRGIRCWWFSAKLWYLCRWCTSDTAILHIDRI